MEQNTTVFNIVWNSELYLDPDQTVVYGYIITAGVEAADMKIIN